MMNQTAKMDARSKDTMRATTNVPIAKQIDNAMYAYTPRFNRSLNFALQSHDWGNSPKWLQLSATDPACQCFSLGTSVAAPTS
jgi:hypothetical protein